MASKSRGQKLASKVNDTIGSSSALKDKDKDKDKDKHKHKHKDKDKDKDKDKEKPSQEKEPISSSSFHSPSTRKAPLSRDSSPAVTKSKRSRTDAENAGTMATVDPAIAVESDPVTTEESSSVVPVDSTAQKKNRDGSYDPSEDENDEDDEDEDESEDEKDVLPPTQVVLPKNKRGRQIKKIVTPQGQFPNSLGSHAHQTIN